jgi:hypothetical protein
MVARFARVFGAAPVTEVVKVVRADDLFPSGAFDFMKIDVEGSEAALLDGATELLARKLPRATQIEIYPDYFEAVHGRLMRHYKTAHRVSVEDGHLIFGNVAASPKGAPIFVYS